MQNTQAQIHTVKSWSMFYCDIIAGTRTSDIRLNDRRYAVGDFMLLREFDPVKQLYTGRSETVLITYLQNSKSNPCAISNLALSDDYVVLSIKQCVYFINLHCDEISD